MSEIEKCAWCGKAPDVLDDGTILCARCPGSPSFRDPSGEHWNPLQVRILAVRRKDFEAGANYGERAAKDYTEDNVEEAFDDYVKVRT